MVLYQFGRVGEGLKPKLHLAAARVVVAGGPEIQMERVAVVGNALRATPKPALLNWVAFLIDLQVHDLPPLRQPTEFFLGCEAFSGTLLESSDQSAIVIADRFLGWEPTEYPDNRERKLCVVLRLNAVWYPAVEEQYAERHVP